MKKSLNSLIAALGLMIFMVLAPIASQAGALSDYSEAAHINLELRGVAFTTPTNRYVGLTTTACSDSATGTEASYTGYARATVAANTTNWSAPNTSGMVSNSNTITVGGAATSGPTTVTHVIIMDAPTAGNMIFCLPLSASKTINNGDPAPQFPAGTLQLWIDQ